MENIALDIIHRWNSEEVRQKMIFAGDRPEAEGYLQAVDVIQRSYDEAAIAIAMSRLQNEFRNFLIFHTNPSSSPHHPSTTEEETKHRNGFGCFLNLRFNASTSAKRQDAVNDRKLLRFVEITYDAIYDLRCIAERMISSGYLCHCVHVYASVRKSAIFANFQRLGIGDVKLPVKAKIQRWINTSTVCVRTLFASEKKLCEQIFDGVGSEIDRACFMETVKEPAIQLLNFADATCKSPTTSPDMLFMILDLYEALSDFHDIFNFKSGESIRVTAAEVLPRLAETVRETLSLFKKTVVEDKSKDVVPGGAIHPFTTHVMNYLNFISNYKKTMNELIVSNPSLSLSTGSIFDLELAYILDQEAGKTPFGIHLICFIEMLQYKLKGKSKQYKDSSLSQVFMMNNNHYIFKKVEGCSELMDIIGNDYLDKLKQKFHEASENYQKATWERVLGRLSEFFLVNESMIKTDITAFNIMFEKVRRSHGGWVIPDLQLRKELRMSILVKLLPAYSAFIRRNSRLFQKGYLVKYLEYSLQDLEDTVLKFFEGTPVSKHSRRRYTDRVKFLADIVSSPAQSSDEELISDSLHATCGSVCSESSS
ncbi:exocyst complex component EXO70B1-like [Abrus precatorius]|uniref:Exocyst subunit Exo70 family protein n=1 Tax=Abrus precatorius TaxID=3816 RepID=A0A8B8KLY6_ABRPR|nr:exocyst complex component EXO70B1-like [Abrus precatorius]